MEYENEPFYAMCGCKFIRTDKLIPIPWDPEFTMHRTNVRRVEQCTTHALDEMLER